MFSNAVSNDARTGLDMSNAIGPNNKRADGYGGIDCAREVDISNNAGIRTALHWLEFVDDFHRSDLGSTRHSSGRKRGPKDIDGGIPTCELARYL